MVVHVSDTGAGIDPRIENRLFQPFVTTKTKGMGLGLPTVYGIVAQSGGHIVVHTEPGKDTRFEILLPERRDEWQDEFPPGSLLQ